MYAERQDSRIIITEEGQFELYYDLTKQPSSEHKGKYLYGAKITMLYKNEQTTEHSGSLSYSREEVVDLIGRLAENTVCPIDMLPIIDEIYSVY